VNQPLVDAVSATRTHPSIDHVTWHIVVVNVAVAYCLETACHMNDFQLKRWNL
jgi:hypothetical protein